MSFVRDWLYVGGYRDSTDEELLQEYNIGAILQLADQIKHAEITVLCLLVDDAQPLRHSALRQGVAFIREQKAAGKNVMVACGAGVSRSVTFAVAALHEEEDISLVEAFKSIHRCHPDALPHRDLWLSLCAYYGQPASYKDVLLAIR